MEEDELKQRITDCVVLGNSDPLEVERLTSCIETGDDQSNVITDRKLDRRNGSSNTETPRDSRTSSISQGNSDKNESDLESLNSASQLQPTTSTPSGTRKGSVRFDFEDSLTCSRESLNPDHIKVPLLGFEIMEERAKFTVFRLRVEKSEHDSWYVFRRYSDFVQLNDKLRRIFPNIRLSLPPKRWFRDNFDKNFIEDRQLGLQAFINNCIGHKEICNSKPVREFFCFDEPPGPHDSIEESRALCESLEDTVYNLRKELSEKDSEIDLLQDELSLYKRQVEMLTQALRKQNESKLTLESPVSTASLAECDLLTCTEADQSQVQKNLEKVKEHEIRDVIPDLSKANSEESVTSTGLMDTPASSNNNITSTGGSAKALDTPSAANTAKKKKRSSIFSFRNRTPATETS